MKPYTALDLTLELGVPLEMQRLADVTPDQLEHIRAAAVVEVASRGDVIQFKGTGTGSATAHLIKGLAVLALTSPGGVTFNGLHWCNPTQCRAECRRAAA